MIKLFGYLLMTVGLIGGSLSAITAYRPLLSMPDDQLIGLTLMESAGSTPGDPTKPVVIAEQDPKSGELITKLTPENLALLREAKVLSDAELGRETPPERLVVKEFAFGRWDYAWAAGVSVALLGIGAFIVKSQVRRQIRAAAAISASDTSRGPTPEVALETIRTTLDSLRRDLDGITDEHARNARIIEVIGELNAVQVAAIVDQRNVILGRMGMGGMASFMDRFAMAERAMNRAWSAAADGYVEEAEECLARAIETIPDAQAKLKG